MRYEISIIAPDGSLITKPSKNPYGFAALYIQTREKFEADAAEAAKRGQPAPRLSAADLDARGAFGVWRVAAMCHSMSEAMEAAKDRARDRGVFALHVGKTEVTEK